MNLFEKLGKFLVSEEGRKFMLSQKEMMEKLDKVLDSQYERFNKLTSEQRSEFIEKFLSFYETEKYINRWESRGIVPPEDLAWFVYDYSIEYGVKAPIEFSYANFCSDARIIDDAWLVRRFDGQGSFIEIIKLDNIRK